MFCHISKFPTHSYPPICSALSCIYMVPSYKIKNRIKIWLKLIYYRHVVASTVRTLVYKVLSDQKGRHWETEAKTNKRKKKNK